MKVSLKQLLIVALLAVALVACTTVKAAPQTVDTTPTTGLPRTITVVGVGQINLTPDVAQINVGVEATASTVTEAKAQVDQQIAAILAALKEKGVAEKDIQTSSYNIYYERGSFPESADTKGQGGYHVSNMLQVTVRAIDQASNVLDAAIAAGANQVYGVTFTVSDDQKWEGQAREKAIADAQTRAKDLARLSGVELGSVVSVSEVVGGSSTLVARDAAYGGAKIAPGELEMSTQVQVTFAIK